MGECDMIWRRNDRENLKNETKRRKAVQCVLCKEAAPHLVGLLSK